MNQMPQADKGGSAPDYDTGIVSSEDKEKNRTIGKLDIFQCPSPSWDTACLSQNQERRLRTYRDTVTPEGTPSLSNSLARCYQRRKLMQGLEIMGGQTRGFVTNSDYARLISHG